MIRRFLTSLPYISEKLSRGTACPAEGSDVSKVQDKSSFVARPKLSPAETVEKLKSLTSSRYDENPAMLRKLAGFHGKVSYFSKLDVFQPVLKHDAVSTRLRNKGNYQDVSAIIKDVPVVLSELRSEMIFAQLYYVPQISRLVFDLGLHIAFFDDFSQVLSQSRGIDKGQASIEMASYFVRAGIREDVRAEILDEEVLLIFESYYEWLNATVE